MGGLTTRPPKIMKYVKVYPDQGEPYWKNGLEPSAKEIGITAAVGVPYSNFVKEYEAHQDRYPTAEDNIKYCELKTRQSRDEINLPHRKAGVRWV